MPEMSGTYVPLTSRDGHSSGNISITLATACKRAGYVFDLWQEDPEELVSMLEKAWDQRNQRHPLALLFEPPLKAGPDITVKSARPSVGRRTLASDEVLRGDSAHTHRVSRDHSAHSHKSRHRIKSDPEAGAVDPDDPHIGKLVKARLSAGMKCLDDGGEKYIDPTREWYHAVVKASNDDDTYTIEWEHQYPEDRSKRADEMIDVFTNSHTDGVRALLVNCKTKKIMWKEIPILLFLFILVASLPEIIFMLTTHRNICSSAHEEGDLGKFCKRAHESRLLGPVIDRFMGITLGCGSIVIVWTLAFIILPYGYKLIHCCSPTRAKKMLQSITLMTDGVHRGLLGNVYGELRIRLLTVLGCSYLISCLSLAVMLIAPGVVPLGFVSTQIALRIMNSALGDEVGLKAIQESRILTILTKLSKRYGLEVGDEELRRDLLQFLQAPNDACTLQVSLPIVTLLSCVANTPQAYSKRISRILVAKAYAAFIHQPKALAQLKATHDIIVDVFNETCEVPGMNLEGERWHKEGQKLPWHLSIDRQFIQYYEEQLQTMGVPPGDNCFTWRSPRNGLWRTQENKNPASRIEAAKGLIKIQSGYDSVLNDLVLDSTLDDKPKLTCALLKAGANPNFRTDPEQPKSSTFVRACGAGKTESINLLLAFKADVEGNGILSAVQALDTPHFNRIKETVLPLIQNAAKEQRAVKDLIQDFQWATSDSNSESGSESASSASSQGDKLRLLYRSSAIELQQDPDEGPLKMTSRLDLQPALSKKDGKGSSSKITHGNSAPKLTMGLTKSRTSALREHGNGGIEDWNDRG